MLSPDYAPEASRLIEGRLTELRRLTLPEAAALPETNGFDTVISGVKASITTFRYRNPFSSKEVCCCGSRRESRWFGMGSHHIERGLMFSPDGKVREATERELQNSGG